MDSLVANKAVRRIDGKGDGGEVGLIEVGSGVMTVALAETWHACYLSEPFELVQPMG